MLENENLNESEKPQLNIGAVSGSASIFEKDFPNESCPECFSTIELAKNAYQLFTTPIATNPC